MCLLKTLLTVFYCCLQPRRDRACQTQMLFSVWPQSTYSPVCVSLLYNVVEAVCLLLLDDALRPGWPLTIYGLLRLRRPKARGRRTYGNFRGSVMGQSVSGFHQEAKVWGAGAGSGREACPVSLVFKSFLISWMNDGIATWILFIKAVDFMKLCVAFSVNPTREAPPQSNSRRLQEQTSPLSEGDQPSRHLPHLWVPTKRTFWTDGGPGIVWSVTQRKEWTAPIPSL